MLESRLETLFHELNELPEEARRARLEEIRSLDATLHRELSGLLEAFDSVGGFLAARSRLEAADRTPPPRLGKYPVHSEIGRGAAGVVYLAHDPDLERRIAIKVFARRSAARRRVEELREEARALAQISHPNIAQVYSIEESTADDGEASALLAMEYVPGATLAERLRAGALPLPLVLDHGRQMAAGLEAAHQQGVVHRDLKPQNLHVTPDGWIKILDFGLARRTTGGTPGYMSPEQCRGESSGATSDLFALGAVLFECLTGRRAIAGETLAELLEANRRGEVRFDGIPAATPPSIVELVRGLLSADPERRVASAGDARRTLEEELLRLRAAELLAAQEETGTSAPSAGKENEGASARAPLPRPWSSFIGRQAVLTQLVPLLEEARLVTLTGPGGVGKTRTALELVGRSSLHPGGIRFVDLSAWSEDAEVPAAIAHSLQVGSAVRDAKPETSVAAAAAAFGGKSGLLLLDNCEHVLAPVAAFVERLLTTAPDLRVLATSRQPLGLAGEHVFPLPPLSLPTVAGAHGSSDSPVTAADDGVPAGQKSSEAETLFLARARSRVPGFAPTPSELETIRQICRRLDGLPLAIELAASQVRALPVDDIFRRVEEGRTLSAGTAVPARHRSLRDLIEWSYRLLSVKERTLLRRLSVFRGGFTLSAAEEVCGDGDGVRRWDICDALSRLVEHSLVEPETQTRTADAAPPAARYRLLETIRVFAADRMAEDELESGAVTQRYLVFVESLVTLRPEENLASRAKWIRRVGPDYANVIHGLELALAHRRIDLAGRIGELSAYYWVQTGEWIEGMGWLDRVLAARPASDLDPAVEVRLLSQAGLLPTLLRFYEKAAPILAEALSKGEALGQPGPLALAHESNGVAAWQLGELDEAQAYLERAVALFEEAGDRGALAINAGNLGVLQATRGQFEEACAHYRRSQLLCAELGDRLAGGKALINLGFALTQLSRFDEAEAALRESLALHEEHQDLPSIVMVHHNLGELFVAKGDFAAARRSMHEARLLRTRMGDRWALAASLPHFYMLLEKEERLEDAAVVLSGLLQQIEHRGVAARPESLRRFREWKESLAARIGAEAAARAEARAASLDVEGLLDLAESTPGSGT